MYPHVKDYKNIVLLENDANNPPDTNSWHTDLTFNINQPFASVLVARAVPDIEEIHYGLVAMQLTTDYLMI